MDTALLHTPPAAPPRSLDLDQVVAQAAADLAEGLAHIETLRHTHPYDPEPPALHPTSIRNSRAGRTCGQ